MCFLLFWELCSCCLDQGTTLQFAYVLSATGRATDSLPHFCCYIQSLQLWFACISLHDLYAFSPGSRRSLHQRVEMQKLGWCMVPTLSIPTLSLNLYLQGVELLSFAYAFRQVETSVCQTLSSSYTLVHWCYGQITYLLIQAMNGEGHYGLRKYTDFRFRSPLLALA